MSCWKCQKPAEASLRQKGDGFHKGMSLDGFASGLSLAPDKIKNQNQTVGKHSSFLSPHPGSLSPLPLSNPPTPRVALPVSGC